LYAIEIGVRPTESGKKSDLQVLAVLAVIVIIAIISISLYIESIEPRRLVLMCIVLPLMTFVIYFAMSFYAKWSSKRSVRKKK
jgi:bacteriorhodopsin